MTECSTQVPQQGSDSPQRLSQQHSPMIPRVVPNMPPAQDPLKSVSVPSISHVSPGPLLHMLERITIMTCAIESFSKCTTSGFSAQEILLESMSTRPKQVGVERHPELNREGKVCYQLARDYCLQFRHMGSHICEFAELTTQMEFT